MHAANGDIRAAYRDYSAWLTDQSLERLRQKHAQADLLFRRLGITFTVYGEDEGGERLIPFDVIPRIISHDEWAILERGAIQRVDALNAFLHDIYHEQEIIRAGIVPAELVMTNEAFQPQMLGLDLPRRVYAHVSGVDVVRVDDKTFYVLEDNVRTPSGVSYMLENRETMMRLFPDLFAQSVVAPVDRYAEYLLRSLQA
ncbi:MAG: hypothetical protein CMF64_02360, partial [Magnetovibrio sp.]|nr:hypothetical protein [Magnetovibrio sp.]